MYLFRREGLRVTYSEGLAEELQGFLLFGYGIYLNFIHILFINIQYIGNGFYVLSIFRALLRYAAQALQMRIKILGQS